MIQRTPRPFFSVVMPVYNAEKFLSKTIESVLGQSDPDWELIVVDDASKDGSVEILEHYAAQGPNVLMMRNDENVGVAKTLNRGIREARGEWIVRLDSDDLFSPDYLTTLRSFIAGLPHCDCFVSSWVTIIDKDGEKVIDVRLPSAKTIAQMMNFENFLYHPATSFPKQVWERVGGYPEEDRRVSEDTEMWKRLFSKGVTLFMLPKHLVHYRIHDSNFTSFKDGIFSGNEDRNRVLARQYHEWRISLFLKQKNLEAARNEILLLRKTQSVFSIKNFFYYFMTLLPKFLVYELMWQIRPRLRRWARASMISLSQAQHPSP